jgi:hypothetical protein
MKSRFVLTAKAQAAGLTPHAWLKQLADTEEKPPADRPMQTAADIIPSHIRNVPPEIMATMPKDGASEDGYYLYGAPKRNP